MAHRCFLAYSILASYSVAGQSPKYVLKGNETSLKPAITGLPDDILWKHEGNNVVKFNGQEEDVFDPYQTRITLDWHSAELKISDLRFEDRGRYDCEVYVNRKLQRSSYELEVIDKVAKPTISCRMNDGSSSDISGTLMCSAEPRQPQSLTRFEWNSSGKHAQQLTIPLGGKHDDEVYSCSVSNPLSRETATFTAKDCYPEKTSVALTVSLVIIIIISVILLVGIVLWTQRRKVQACLAPAPPAPRGTTEDGTTENEEKRPLFKAAPTVEEHRIDFQDAMPEKGHVKEFRTIFEPEENKNLSTAQNKDEQEETVHPPASPHSESASPDEHAEKDVSQCEPSDSDSPNEPGPAADSGNVQEVRKILEQEGTKNLSSGSAQNKDEQEETVRPPASPHSESASPDERAEKDVSQCEPSDSERANEPDPAADSGNVQEVRKILEREGTKTLSSAQNKDKQEETVRPPASPHSKSASPDERAEKDVSQCEPSDSESPNEPDPAAGSSQDGMSNLEYVIGPE